VLPAVRYAVDAYVNFARQKPWIEAVASSLTELFGPAAIRVRLEALEPGRTTYLYLPLAHSFALLIQLLSFDVGGVMLMPPLLGFVAMFGVGGLIAIGVASVLVSYWSVQEYVI
jgi:hypothetical protein